MPSIPRSQLCACYGKRIGDPGNRESPKMPGARVPVVQREEDPADEDKHWDQDKVGGKPRRLEEGEEGIAAEVQGRHRQPADHRHTEEAEAQQVCGLLVGLREHDREFASGMQAMTPSMLVSEVNSVRNYWYGDLYPDFKAMVRSLTEAFRGGVIPDPFDNQKNLIVGVASLDWYADRLEKIIGGMDALYTPTPF